jgi:IclR family acetate operon transcriptional repressor
VGKAYLAGLAPARCEDQVDRLPMEAFTAATNTDRVRLREQLAEARARGWTEEHGEFDPASSCYGAPVFDQSGSVAAAISLAGPSPRMQDNALGALVAEAATAISRRLGHAVPSAGLRRG